MKRWAPFVLAILTVTGFAIAAELVDQGMPGNYGPWPVTATISTSVDGGVSVTPQRCTVNAHKNTVVGVAATSTPSTQLAGRRYITICNSLQNAGNPILKCRVDATAPVAAAGNAGDVLGIGDCIQYAIYDVNVPSCISDAVGTNATSYECQ